MCAAPLTMEPARESALPLSARSAIFAEKAVPRDARYVQNPGWSVRTVIFDCICVASMDAIDVTARQRAANRAVIKYRMAQNDVSAARRQTLVAVHR